MRDGVIRVVELDVDGCLVFIFECCRLQGALGLETLRSRLPRDILATSPEIARVDGGVLNGLPRKCDF